LANVPKKSQRTLGVAGKASASGRSPAVNGTSNRLRPKPKEPEPEPEVEEVEEVAEEIAEAPVEEESESLLGDLGAAVDPTPKGTPEMPLKADEHLLSDDSLYGDDDPLEKEKARKKAMIMKPPAKPSARGPAAKPEDANENSKSSMSKRMPAKGVRNDSRTMKAATPESETAPEEAPVAAEPDEAQATEPSEEKKTSRKAGAAKSTSRIMKGQSRRAAKVEPEPEEEEVSNRVSRRTTKRSMRGKAVGFTITKTQKILAIVGVVLVIAVIAGYGPVMKSIYTKGIVGPDATVESRKSSVKSLFEFDPEAAYTVCGQAMINPDAGIREAGIYGMELLGKSRSTRGLAISSLGSNIAGADAAGKVLMIKSFGEIAQSMKPAGDTLAKNDDRAKEDLNDLITISASIMPRAEASSEPAVEVRAASVAALGTMKVPGVCKMLVKIATSGDEELKSKARDGIAMTALPDSAGALLEAVGGPDKALSRVAKDAFVQVRDSAKSEVLAGLVSDPSDDVRREVVAALAKRSNDKQASMGLIHAIKDKLPEVRASAVKGLPITGMTGSPQQLAELVTDSDETVRVETANTLAELRDPESAKIVLEAFKNPMSGKTMSAFVTALGKVTSGKDLKACAIVMGILDRNPGAEASVKEAMALLTQSNAGSSRISERRQWPIDKWKEWWANISEREKLRKNALEKLEALKKHKDDDHSTFPQLMRDVEAQIDTLEKCTDMCTPNDPEDVPLLRDQQHQYTFLKEHFMKNASINMKDQ
jgi:HEAT repeat protein